MFFILSKILLFFTQPLIWILTLLVLAYFKRNKRLGKGFLYSAISIFILFSNGFLFNEVFKRWEGQNENRTQEHYDAVVVLGGFSSWNSRQAAIGFNQANDRLIEGLRMYHRKEADKILISGGSGLILKPEEKESLLLLEVLTDLNVKQDDLILESTSRNTYENAKYSTQILKETYGVEGSFALITSAFHMRRAKSCFEKYGMNFDYIRTDFYVDDADYDLSTYLLPSAHVLNQWQILIKEWLGYGMYWVRSYF